jgi:hypothetical protein
MNRNDDFDDSLSAWLRGEAPPEAPDRVLDMALRRVADHPQRRGWLDRVQKGTQMSLILRATAVAGVIAIAAFMGLRFNNLTPGVGGLSSPSPTEAATPAASTTPVPPVTSPTPIPVPTGTPLVGCVNPPPDIAALTAQTDPVACYGNAPLTLDAYPTVAQIDCPVTVEPVWLACGGPNLLMRVGETSKFGPELVVSVDPASGISFSDYLDKNVRITGHYDDPAAQTCRETWRAPDIGATPEPAAATIEGCRRKFVVTQVAPLGSSSPVGPSIEPTPFTPPLAQCPSPAGQVRLPDVTVSVGGAPGIVGTRGPSTTLTCTTTGTQDVVPSDPTGIISAANGDRLKLALSTGWGFLRVEGSVMTPIDTTDRPSLIEVPVSSPTGESIVRLNLWLVRDDGRVVGQMEISFRVRVR